MNTSVKKEIYKCVAEIFGQYITVGQEYEVTRSRNTVSYHRVVGGAGSFMPVWFWDKYVKEGKIVKVN